MEENTKVKEFVADSNVAFMQGNYEKALEMAKKAISQDDKNADAYLCAGNANMSFSRYDEAIKNYQKSVECDPENGDRYFHLGYALATNNQSADALAAFAKADELECSPEVTGQLYKILGMLCFDMRNYKDAVINLNKSEKVIGIDMDILQRKALSFGMIGEIASGIEVANQIKMLAPSNYLGYRIAKELLLQENRNEEAEQELDRAKRFADLNPDYFMDCLSLELAKYALDKEEEHLDKAIDLLNEELIILNPTVENVVDCYLNAAEVYVQKEDADMALSCLNAAENPAQSYNQGFSIKKIETVLNPGMNFRPSERQIDQAIEEVRRRYTDRDIERMGNRNSRVIFESREGSGENLTPIKEDMSNENAYELDESKEYDFPDEKNDQINRLYVAVYTLKNDTAQIKTYASLLANSSNKQSQYIGKYSMVKAMKDEGYANINEEYDELIRFYRNESIKDPTNLMTLSFRIQCLIDIGEYNEAEELCELLSEDLRKPLIEQIEKSKAMEG